MLCRLDLSSVRSTGLIPTPVPNQGGVNSSTVDNGDSEGLSMATMYIVGAVVIVLLCAVVVLLLMGLVFYTSSY